jgi:hypothetical protein
MGTGRTLAPAPPRYRNRGRPALAAPALAVARETASMALAPRRALLGRAVELNHDLIDLFLVGGIEADDRVGDLAVNVLDGLQDALATVAN